ncbi:MAG: acylneuraminate cytidylyltransferase family protein [SAR324 cluster bacterium]|uniref:Acylneuraminate cytidylyltransferase family protein n=1 Tax=SAR324 cluster bacterium TaxID=2024889 RepID=A0A7X9FRD6_9DELT|nr:acylneuraminate cytidylyltransferase family protein [SAR324 cluster bacterium]
MTTPFNNSKKLCTICARGGSQGVPNKNIRPLLGKPLISHSILQAKASKLFEVIAVSSDSSEILSIAKEWGADLLINRPSELASHAAPKIPAIRHCVTEAESLLGVHFDVCVDLDATSPLRNVRDIIDAVKLLERENAENVITACPARRSPYFNLVELNSDGIAVLSKASTTSRRQDSPPCYDMNASIYVWQRDVLFSSDTLFNRRTLLYVMPDERSLDIDSELDFEFVELLARKRGSLNELS